MGRGQIALYWQIEPSCPGGSLFQVQENRMLYSEILLTGTDRYIQNDGLMVSITEKQEIKNREENRDKRHEGSG